MKKQSGFTLIELMVVMAIIAILATAGLSAYTGYIKKARDTTRIADIAAINTIALAQLSTTGEAPALGTTSTGLRGAIMAANNNVPILDPLAAAGATYVGTQGPASCLIANSGTSTTAGYCNYFYQTCDSLTSYRILTRFESTANSQNYNVTSLAATTATTPTFYAVGSCVGGGTVD